MSWLVLKAYVQLIRFDFHLRRQDFAVLYDRVRKQPLPARNNRPPATA